MTWSRLHVVNGRFGSAEGMYDWYEQVIGIIMEVDNLIPVCDSDGWDFGVDVIVDQMA